MYLSAFLIAFSIATCQSALKDAATKQSRYFGTAAAPRDINDATAKAVLDAQFNSITPENEMKWDATEKSRGSFSFSAGDTIANHATQAGMKLRGHTLVWHSQLPSWVSGLNATDLKAAMENHIKEVVTHYKGKVYAWDVVNEIFEESGQFRSSPFYQKLGKDFVADAFKTAAAADPNAKLYINDYNVEGVNSKSTAMYNLVKELKAAGVPIHGAGFQSHFTVGGVAGNFQENLKRFSDLGVDVAITELDIRMQMPSDSSKLQTQAQNYATVVKACLAVTRCVGITVWGISDKNSWVPSTFSGQGAALLFDDNYKAKPAVDAVTAAFG